MAIAHICLGCGLDLARVRAFRDIHYGLPLVICPGCDNAIIRRRHPIQRSLRSFLRIKKSLCTFFWHAIVLLTLLAINVASIAFIARLPVAMRDYGFQEYPSEIVLSLAVVPFVTGVWLSVGLNHLGRWRAFAAWTTLVAAFLSIEVIGHVIGLCFGLDYYISAEPIRMINEWIAFLWSLGVVMALSLSGIPVGARIRKAHARHRAHYWRKRMRRMRKRRGGT